MNKKVIKSNISSDQKKHAQLALQIGVPFGIFVVLFYITFSFSSYFAYKRVYTDARQMPVLDASKLVYEISEELAPPTAIGQLGASLLSTWDKEQVYGLAKRLVIIHPEILRITYFGMDKNSLWEVMSSPGVQLGASSPLRVISGVSTKGDFSNVTTPYLLHKQQYPIYDLGGHQIGVLEMLFDTTALWPILTHASVSDVYIVNREGTILLSRRSVVRENNIIKKEILDNYRTQFGKPVDRVDENGVKLTGVAMPIESVGWIVIAENSLEGAASSTRSMLLVAGFLGATLLFVSIYEWYVARKRIFNPLYSLRKNAESIAGGDYNAWVQVNSGNEFDKVATVMNTMAYSIKQFKAELEERIQERTKHLAQKTDEAERLSAFMVNRELRMLELKEENQKLRKIFEGDDEEKNKDTADLESEPGQNV